MRLHRFYIHKPLGEEIVVESVSEKEFKSKLLHQWLHVFRYTSGDEVILFSSLTPGSDYTYRISSVSKDHISLSPVSSSPNVMPSFELTLVMALIKKDSFETVVRQATELGVTRIIPVIASRSEKKNLNFERLSSIAREATEQSGRGTPPTITEICSYDDAFTLTGSSVNIMGSLHGQLIGEVLSSHGNKAPSIALWIGPEGGWTAEEEEHAVKAGVSLLKFIETTLKADTAVTSLLSVILTLFHKE